jgi:hypothetical protein
MRIGSADESSLFEHAFLRPKAICDRIVRIALRSGDRAVTVVI